MFFLLVRNPRPLYTQCIWMSHNLHLILPKALCEFVVICISEKTNFQFLEFSQKRDKYATYGFTIDFLK